MALQRRRAAANTLLERLPGSERRCIDAVAQSIDFAPGDVLFDSGGSIEHVYFPRRGIVSLFARDAGNLIGVDLVGPEGMVGLDVLTGRRKARLLAAAQGHGSGERISAADFGRVLRSCPDLREGLLAYAQAAAAQLARNIVCTAFHPSRKRLARWLLDVTRERTRPLLFSTQADIAVSLGVKRAAVSYAAADLQRSGLIRYLRGEVTILDRAGLRVAACSCSLESA